MENTCAKLFLNPRINVDVIAPTSSIMAILSFDLQVWPWPSTYQANVSNGTTTLQGEYLSKTILKSKHKCRSYGPDKLIYDQFIIWPSSVTLTFNYLKKVSNDTTPPQEQKLC